MPKVILVHPTHLSSGFGLFTPRWLFVLAAATPKHVGDPVIVDETIEPFDENLVNEGDIVGIGIVTGNCVAGYHVLAKAKRRGATVVFGGLHASIFPEEPLRKGADAVVTGSGDTIWSQVVSDALAGRLQRRYDGGLASGSEMTQARWDLLDPKRYLFPTIQTVAGCPENCSFCSIWVTDGREPRLQPDDQVIAEANQLYSMGFRYVAFTDDNFSPATTSRIRREESDSKRSSLEAIRRRRLDFFAKYSARVPPDLVSITQLTAEAASDDEYLKSIHANMRLRAALIGVESFGPRGLDTVNKHWNPAEDRMVNAIRRIQEQGILVLASLISGLESDDPSSLRRLSRRACDSGALLASFSYFTVYPGTRDYYDFLRDLNQAGTQNFAPRRRVRLSKDGFWLDRLHASRVVSHPQMTNEVWVRETKECWDEFYSVRQALKRLQSPILRSQRLGVKVAYLLAGRVFRRLFRAVDLSDTPPMQTNAGFATRALMRAAMAAYNWANPKRAGHCVQD